MGASIRQYAWGVDVRHRAVTISSANNAQVYRARMGGGTSRTSVRDEARETRELGLRGRDMAKEIIGQVGVRQVQKAGKSELIFP